LGGKLRSRERDAPLLRTTNVDILVLLVC